MKFLSFANIIKTQYTIRINHLQRINSAFDVRALMRSLLIAAAIISAVVHSPAPASGQQDGDATRDGSRTEEKGVRGKLKIDYGKKADFLKKGKKYLMEDDLESAIYCATYAIANNFDAYESYLLFADIYKKKESDRDEAASLESVVANAPNERLKKEAQKRLDSVLKKIKSENIKKRAEAVKENPQSASRVLRLGDVLSSYKDDEGAELQYKYADTLGKKMKSSKYAQIRLYLRTGKTFEARKQIKNYLALEPDDTQMVYLLAYNGFNFSEIKELGYNGGGKIDMRKFNRVYAEFYFKTGYYQYLKEKFESARISFTYALEYFSTHAGAHKYLGDIYYRAGMFRESREHLKIAYEIIPTDYEVGLQLSKVLLLMDKKSEARYILKGLIKTNNKSKEYAALLKESGMRQIEIEKLGYEDPDMPPPRRRKPQSQQGTEGQPGMPGTPATLTAPGLNDPFYAQPLTSQPYVDPLTLQQQQNLQNQMPAMPPMPQ
ncbi:MAG TPA: hypothetical protein PKK26_17650 [Candidatus Wallbacteria bacterium]|nr:hypothetical protein [Candidatus Wallbacteria bacterium]